MKVSEIFAHRPLVRLEQLSFAIDRELRWPRRKRRIHKKAEIESYESRVLSQHGEDGILEEIFSRLNVSAGRFVEFGVGDGRECNCARLVIEDGWSGLMIEAGAEDYAAAVQRYGDYPAVAIRQKFVSAENISEIFVSEKVPIEFDLLSIDVDGNDYWIWKRLSSFRPKVVIIECNPFFEPPQRWVLPYDAAFRWNGDWRFGASLAALEALAQKLGYALLGCDKSATNALFVRDDLLDAARFPRVSSERAYAEATRFAHFSRSKDGMPYANGYE